MSVNIVLITHQEIGHALSNATKTTFGDQLPLAISTVEIQPDTDPETFIPELKKLVKALDQGDGVLILTDLFGATPCNIARQLQEDAHIRLVAGLNLSMLIRVMNYANLNLNELAETALKGGHEGIIDCGCKKD
jgi:PTS system ascorbate-specific IIA component